MATEILKELRLDIEGELYDIISTDIATTEQYTEGTSEIIVPSVKQVKLDVNAINVRIDSTNAGLVALTENLADNYYDKEDIDLKISSVYKYRGSVLNYDALPTDGNIEGDVYNLMDTGDNWAWVAPDGEVPGVWDKLGGTVDLRDYVTYSVMQNNLLFKQDVLIPGTNITIAEDGKTISATLTSVIATNEEFTTGTATDKSTSVKQVKDALALKQDNLTAGTNITINSGTIDATLTNVLASDADITAGTETTKAPTVKQMTAAIQTSSVTFTVEEIPDSGGRKRGILTL